MRRLRLRLHLIRVELDWQDWLVLVLLSPVLLLLFICICGLWAFKYLRGDHRA